MARYTPAIPPANYDPAWMLKEVNRIAQAMETQDTTLSLDKLYAAPAKYRDGTIARADGTTWNPGSGAGVYCYYSAAWHLLG